MATHTDLDVSELQQKLVELQRTLERRLESTRQDSKPVDLETPIGRISRIDAIQSQKLAEASREQAEVQLRRVRAALARMQAGRYGLCLMCDEPIAPSRLRKFPEAPLCRQCQAGME